MRTYYAIQDNKSKKYLDFNRETKHFHLKTLNSVLHFYNECPEHLVLLLQLAYNRPRFNINNQITPFNPRKDIPLFDESFVPEYESLSLVKYSWNLEHKKNGNIKIIRTVLSTSPLPLFQKVNLYFLMEQFTYDNLCLNLKVISHLSLAEIINNYQIDSHKYKIIQPSQYIQKTFDCMEKQVGYFTGERFILTQNLKDVDSNGRYLKLVETN